MLERGKSHFTLALLQGDGRKSKVASKPAEPHLNEAIKNHIVGPVHGNIDQRDRSYCLCFRIRCPKRELHAREKLKRGVLIEKNQNTHH